MLSLNLGDDDSREKDIDFNGNDLIMGRQLHSAVSTSPLLAAVVRKHTDVCTLQYARELNICSLQIQVQDLGFLTGREKCCDRAGLPDGSNSPKQSTAL